MKTRAELLAWKRQQLLAESHAQRAELAVQLQPLSWRLESVETGMRILRRVRRHPGWIAAGAAGLVLLTPRRLSSWLRAGAATIRTWRSIAPALRMLSGRE
ncbi:MAG TPA: YqjK family protein [Noviherbaspirillum sp.]|uniref:YqjK family protein n=1 Tax=Noviherbaspirillum sp. TaxID=1926288 RepID=UPI002D2439B0|nr:YqjK family protein [Noviherbaspirillum sp.]HYD96409.1 YqjK family protein [Noviherbaspirillum sp.]